MQIVGGSGLFRCVAVSTALVPPHPQPSTSATAIQKQYDAIHQGQPSDQPRMGQITTENGTVTGGTQQVVQQEGGPEVDIVINNVVCSFNVRCHLNLRDIALRGLNVEYRRENGMVTMKLRRPYTTASMWSSGKITCTGANSEDQAKTAARKYARFLQKLGFNCRFRNYRVVNVLGTCTMPFAIKITQFSQEYRQASYEPELHPGVTYRIDYPKATLKIFSTGSITITAPCVSNVQSAVEHIYPLVYRFRKQKTPEDIRVGANVPNPLAGNGNHSARGKKRRIESCTDDTDDHLTFESYEDQDKEERGVYDSGDSD